MAFPLSHHGLADFVCLGGRAAGGGGWGEGAAAERGGAGLKGQVFTSHIQAAPRPGLGPWHVRSEGSPRALCSAPQTLAPRSQAFMPPSR